MRPRPGRHTVVVALTVLVATGGYVYVINSINLPEEIEIFIAAGVGIGLAVGRWPVVVAALAVFSIAAFDPLGPTDETWTLIWFVYLLGAALSISVGVAIRLLADRALVRGK